MDNLNIKDKAKISGKNLKIMKEYLEQCNWENDGEDPIEMRMATKESGCKKKQGNNKTSGKSRSYGRGKNNNYMRQSGNYENYMHYSNSFHYRYTPPLNTNLSKRENLELSCRSSSRMNNFNEIFDPGSNFNCAKSFYQQSISPDKLVSCLNNFENFSASLLTIFDQYDLNYKEVETLAKKYSHTFDLNNEILFLNPKLSICESHCTPNGCISEKSCKNLHLCPKFVHNLCYNKSCLMGHYMKTNHNLMILKFYFISHLNVYSLKRLFSRMPLKGNNEKSSNLNICLDYNDGKCQKESCPDLHFCLAFLSNICFRDDCQLNHSITSSKNKLILEKYGVSLNESPKDILLNVKSFPLVQKELDKFSASGLSKGNILNSKIDQNISSNKIDRSKNGNISTPKGDKKVSNSNTHKETSKATEKVNKTVWSHYFIGEVTLEEICFDSVEKLCSYEERGCWRLHCNNHFHWQIKNGEEWLNLREYQSIALEKAFCDPQIGKIDMPALDPSTLEPNVKGLLIVLQGRSQWEADFDLMKLNLKKSETQQTAASFELRRLCTEDTPADKKPDCCWFSWYFLDKNSKWIEYGNVDSTGDESLISTLASNDIEKHRRDRPSSPLIFQNDQYSYILDTIELTQTNLDTNMTRKIRRRPRPHLKDEEQSEMNLPVFWEPMDTAIRVRRVVIPHSSEEYQKIITFMKTQGSNYDILKIERIQNPFLYKAFQNKVQEMISVLKSKEAVNIQQLFHGTNPNVVTNICEQNFDWRLHGTSAGQAYGQGTYFSPLPSTSYSYTRADTNGNRYMFIAQVAVGATIQGSSSMTRPPINPQTNIPFDSTVNQIGNPSVIVKYDKQEYYPEYILTLK